MPTLRFNFATLIVPQWALPSGNFESAKLTMTMLLPSSGMSSYSRYLQAYPGLAYRVPVAVLGGAWPYLYELTTAPSGMAIGSVYGDSNYGVITWDSPTAGTHSVAVRVTDQENTTVTYSWTLTVTTSNTIFVDATAGDGGSGTIASPFNTIEDFWGSDRNSATYAGYHVYFKNGTYYTDDGWDSVWYPGSDGSNIYSIAWRGSKPLVLLAYPGHSPVIDTSAATFWATDPTYSVDLFVHGITFRGICTNADSGQTGRGVQYWHLTGADRACFFENTFEQVNTAQPSNPSHLFLDSNDDVAIVGNTFDGLLGPGGMFALETYRMDRVLVANNVITDSGDGTTAFYLKNTNNTFSIRGNVGLTGNAARFVRIDTYGTGTGGIEICWNNWKTTGEGPGSGQETAALAGPVWDYRNTYQMDYSLMRNTSGGNWYVIRNVIVHDGTQTQGYGLSSSSITITRTDLAAATSGLVDSATGLLTGTDRTTYLGSHGHEVSSA